MNPMLWMYGLSTLFYWDNKKSAERKRRANELKQMEIQDKLNRIQNYEDPARYMGEVNRKDYIMTGQSDPALWSTLAQVVNPLDHEAQAQINADLYDTTTDVADIEDVPTGFVAEGYSPSGAADATRVSGNVANRNK